MRFADVDAVTIDGYGTLLRLVHPARSLVGALSRHGVECSEELAARAFAAEAAYYRPRSHEGRDAESLARLRRECTAVFLAEAGAELGASAFVDDFIGALRFEAVPGAPETLAALRARGLALAVVANWDCSLAGHVARLDLARYFDALVTSAEAGAPKPEPEIFQLALERLGVEPDRAVHVGDEPIDEQGALAAGMRFQPAPLSTAFSGWW